MSGELGPSSAAREAIRPIASVVRCRKGAVAFEFILVAPLLLLILFAIGYFGVALNQQLILTAAAEQGAQTLALLRNQTLTPYTTTKNAVQSAAVNLTAANISQTFTVNGSTCSGDSGCSSLLNNPQPLGAQGKIASVALTYPCQLTFIGYSYSPCTLSANSAATIQ